MLSRIKFPFKNVHTTGEKKTCMISYIHTINKSNRVAFILNIYRTMKYNFDLEVFTCNDGEEIDGDHECDGYEECEGGEDEEDCGKYIGSQVIDMSL